MYSDYDLHEEDDGSVSACRPDTKIRIINCKTEPEVEQRMAQLEVAYMNGVVDGAKEERARLKAVLGLL